MRVGLFTNNYLPFRGGVTTAVETLRESLEQLGHDVWVFAPATRDHVADRPRVFRYPSVPAPTYPAFSLPWPVSPTLAAVARDLRLDVLHAHHPFLLGVTARRLARRLGRPLVFTYHTRYEKYAHYVPLPQRLVAAAAIRLACRFAASADLVVAPSEQMGTMLRSRGVRAPIAVVPTGVPLDVFSPSDRAEARAILALPIDAPLCLYVGRLDREKSVERVLEAFGVVASAVSGSRLVLVGQGTHEPALRRIADAMPSADRIHFAGAHRREALPPFYRAADVFMFASETETQGLVLAEAHACGLPAVAVRASGVEEVVRDGETGLLTKSDARDLADGVIGLLLDPVRRAAMGRAARRLAEAQFSSARQVDVIVAHYDRLRGGRV